ncbi:translation initiation factor IF-2-like [Pteropus medius]|uniref:translation initiation factor IF-2-like n=1 Tax=Pteropus vampyrus TaxID=132908 RepID=UPI00196B7CB2|nr:translation initiation factor IF-2-like [Pteropus giganteus]
MYPKSLHLWPFQQHFSNISGAGRRVRRARGPRSRSSRRLGRRAGGRVPAPRRAPGQAGTPREAEARPSRPPPAARDHVSQRSPLSPRLRRGPAASSGCSAARPLPRPSSAPAPQRPSLAFKPTTPRVFRTRQWPARGVEGGALRGGQSGTRRGSVLPAPDRRVEVASLSSSFFSRH